MAVNPKKTYDALGAFIGRRAPYQFPDMPSQHATTPDAQKVTLDFGATATEDDALLQVIDGFIPATSNISDHHVVLEDGPYKDFDAENPSTLKSEDLPDEAFLRWKMGGDEAYKVTKAIRIQYTHTRKADGKKCTAFILVGFTGDSH